MARCSTYSAVNTARLSTVSRDRFLRSADTDAQKGGHTAIYASYASYASDASYASYAAISALESMSTLQNVHTPCERFRAPPALCFCDALASFGR